MARCDKMAPACNGRWRRPADHAPAHARHPEFPWLLYYLVYDLGDIVTMRKGLPGIKARAERAVAPVLAEETVPTHS